MIVAKGLGGGGVNNAMLYVRALASDFRKWNLKGWDWNTILGHYLSIGKGNKMCTYSLIYRLLLKLEKSKII